ncbi:hypothetical protein [Microvirga zambiensis]|uniref:hypothetical protein n=1 Tax=Microvirga zambiensis TaxID=1402137 RepID=UPI00191C93F2|nr:hypothetical protein [Microvirga zambiensis]
MDRQLEHWALVRRTDQPNSRLAIFVHGFRGGYLSTWGRLPDCLRDFSDNHPVFGSWDYLFIGYQTSSIASFLRIAELIATQWQRAAEGEPPFLQRYAKLALFGHSLGTLGVRQLLCATSKQPSGLISALHSVVLFGSPLNGSPLAPFGRASRVIDMFRGPAALLPSSYAIADALRPDSPHIEMLRTWTATIRQYVRLPDPLVIQGTDDAVVGTSGSHMQPWDGDRLGVTALDHRDLSKIYDPGCWANSSFVDTLHGALK